MCVTCSHPHHMQVLKRDLPQGKCGCTLILQHEDARVGEMEKKGVKKKKKVLKVEKQNGRS